MSHTWGNCTCHWFQRSQRAHCLGETRGPCSPMKGRDCWTRSLDEGQAPQRDDRAERQQGREPPAGPFCFKVWVSTQQPTLQRARASHVHLKSLLRETPDVLPAPAGATPQPGPLLSSLRPRFPSTPTPQSVPLTGPSLLPLAPILPHPSTPQRSLS